MAVKGVGESQKVKGRMNKQHSFIHLSSQSVGDLSSTAFTFKGSRRGLDPFLAYIGWRETTPWIISSEDWRLETNNITHIHTYAQFKFQSKLEQLNSKNLFGIKIDLLFWNKNENRIFNPSSSGLFSHSAKMASQQQPGGPMAQPGLQQPTSLQQQHQLSQQQDFDPVHRFKMLIPQLKESLQVSFLQ